MNQKPQPFPAIPAFHETANRQAAERREAARAASAAAALFLASLEA